jgi:hypothetical protein
MKVGVLFRETFRGSYHRLDDPLTELAADVHLIVHLDEWRRLLREGVARAAGTVTLEGLVDRAALEGTVRFRLRSEKRVPYDLAFVAEDRAPYRLRARREPHPVSPLEVLTNLRFSLYDAADREIGRGLVRCDLRSDLKKTLASVRLRLAS